MFDQTDVNSRKSGRVLWDSAAVMIVFPFLFSFISVLYTQLFNGYDCRYDVPVSASFFFVTLAYLVSRTLRHSDLRGKGIQKQDFILPPWSYLSLSFGPALLYVFHQWYTCAIEPVGFASNAVRAIYALSFFGVILLFLIAAVRASSISYKTREDYDQPGVSKYITIPAALVTLFISMGSSHVFAYLSNTLSETILEYVLDFRILILSLIVIFILVDAVFIFSPRFNIMRMKMDSIADGYLSPLPLIPPNDTSIRSITISMFNALIILARFLFQFITYAGLFLYFSVASLLIAIWRFFLSPGVKYSVILSIVMILSVIAISFAIPLLGNIRGLVLGIGPSGPIAKYLLCLAVYLLFLCLTFENLARTQGNPPTTTTDGAAIVVSMAVVGLWIASFALHFFATIATLGAIHFLHAPGFVGVGSSGWFVWLGFAGFLLAAGSIALWSRHDAKQRKA